MKLHTANAPKVTGNAKMTPAEYSMVVAQIERAEQKLKANLDSVIRAEVAAAVAKLRVQIDDFKASEAERQRQGMTVHSAADKAYWDSQDLNANIDKALTADDNTPAEAGEWGHFNMEGQ